jgi:hypothetical protein
MTTALWLRVPLERIELRPLRKCRSIRQEWVEEKLEDPLSSYSGDPHIHVVCWHGEMWISDGHHRVAAALILGRAYLWGRVLGVVDRRR